MARTAHRHTIVLIQYGTTLGSAHQFVDITRPVLGKYGRAVVSGKHFARITPGEPFQHVRHKGPTQPIFRFFFL
jgi:hypothetical protein